MKMKWKIFSIVVSLVLVFGVGVFANAEGEFAIVGESVQAQAGDQVTVKVMLENNPGVSALNLYYIYDQEVLSLTNVENNVSHFTMLNEVTTTWDAPTNYEEDGVLATLTFTVAEDAPVGEYTIELMFVEGSNDALEEVTAKSGIATIVVGCSHKNTTSFDQVDATCNQSGFTAGVYCNDCEIFISGHEEIESNGEHSDADGEWNYNEEEHYYECSCGVVHTVGSHDGGKATCITKAVCDICKVEYGSVDATAHDKTQVRDASEATCNKDGYTGDTYCVDCDEKLSTGSAIPATGDHIDANNDALCDNCNAQLPKEEQAEEEVPEEVNPGTGDAGAVWAVILMICAATVIVCIRKKKDMI